MHLFRLFFLLLVGLSLEACKEKTIVKEENPQIIIQEEAKEPGPARQEGIQSYASVIKKVAPAVVNIYAFQEADSHAFSSPFMNDPFFREFFDHLNQGKSREQISLGSGVIVSEDGYILTNAHVVDHADIVQVSLSDKREYEAKVILTDKQTDLSLLKISDSHPFPFMVVQAQENLEVGDVVLAIGNPFGVGQTVTSGIVSALARSQEGISDVRTFIQTDAAINPGNSGGPLITTDGRMIGINTAIFSKSGGSMGIGFAIPIGLAVPVIESMAHGGKIERPWIGLSAQEVTYEESQTLGLPHPYGVLVKGIYPGGAADKAGLKVGDFIADFNGHQIKDEGTLDYMIAVSPVGEKVNLTIFRKGGKQLIPLTLTSPPHAKDINALVIKGRNPLQGASLKDLSPALALTMRLNPMQTGVVITNISQAGYAARLGVKPGDVLRSINGEKINTKEEVSSVLQKQVPSWSLVIQRGKKTLKLQVRA